MSDPRSSLTFKCQANAASQQSDMRSFGNAVGKIGDLQVLNSIGGGAIGRGLRTLASISNSIRGGCGSLPTSIGSTIEAGANWVLEQTGIGSTIVDAVSGFNPQIANQAWGQAQQIYQAVKNGKFTAASIPGVLQDLQNLERLGRNIFTNNTGNTLQTVDCLASPYAMDLISRAPKHKFMFVVSFIFNPGYSLLDSVGGEVAFVVKKSSRPNMKFQMEDVNYYNFRTKVVTRTEFEEMSMTFHDDMTNNSLLFYNAYRNALAPITNMGVGQSGLLNPEENGMNFSQLFSNNNPINSTNLPTNYYSASNGPLYGDQKEVLRAVRLFHIYDAGRLMNVFEFQNPRISELTLDDVDMSAGDGSEVGIKFGYDNVYIDVGVAANSSKYTTSSTFLPGTDRSALYPLRYNSTAGAMDSAHKSMAVYGASGSSSACGTNTTSNSPDSLISGGGIGGALSSATSTVTSALSGSVSGALSGLESAMSGALSGFDSAVSGVTTDVASAASSLASNAVGSASNVIDSLI